jgi:hypothetical protein
MNEMLLERIYEDQTPDDLIRRAWVGALLVLRIDPIFGQGSKRSAPYSRCSRSFLKTRSACERRCDAVS